MKIVNLEQNSEAWLDWRKTGIGSSDAPAILGISPWKTRRELWEEKVMSYHTPHKIFSSAQLKIINEKMKARECSNESAKNRGKTLEPEARAEYERWMNISCDTICGVHEDHEYLKVSLDGWTPEIRHFIEIKAPNRGYHENSLDRTKNPWDRLPEIYKPQIWHQFVVSDALTGHYVSYHPKFPPASRLAIVPLTRDEEQLRNFLAIETEFWEMVKSGKYEE